MEKTTQLFDGFRPVSKAEWLAKVERDLKGKPIADLDFEIGGIPFSPFNHSDDMVDLPMPLLVQNGWEIGEDIHVNDDLIKSNSELLNALENGVNAPRLILDENISGGSLAILLSNVGLEMISLHFFSKNKNAKLISLLTSFLKYISLKELSVKKIKASFNWENSASTQPEEMSQLLEQIKDVGQGIKFFTISGENDFSDENPVDELLEILIRGENFLHQYASEKHPPAFINQHLQFSVAIGKNYFIQIAKLRALRMLWANILKAYNIADAMPPIEAHLATACQSGDDHSNMIAATAQAMSAIIGGADRLTVLPADAHFGKTSGFTRRIARNVQHILQLESYFDRVADPAAGSYFVEKLTLGIAEKVWALFQEKK